MTSKLSKKRLPRGRKKMPRGVLLPGEREFLYFINRLPETKVVHFIHFKEVNLHFGFMEQTAKMELRYPRNCFLSKRKVYLVNGLR